VSKTITRRTIFEAVISGRTRLKYSDRAHYNSVMNQDDKKEEWLHNR